MITASTGVVTESPMTNWSRGVSGLLLPNMESGGIVGNLWFDEYVIDKNLVGGHQPHRLPDAAGDGAAPLGGLIAFRSWY